MIRGAIILAVGFSLGYAKAVSDQEEIRAAALTFKQFLEDLALQEEVKRKQEADAKAGAKEEETVVDSDVEEVLTKIENVVEGEPEGETP